MSRVAALLVAIRVALWWLPFRLLSELPRQPILAGAFPRRVVDVPEARLIWAVQAANRRLPGMTCLTRSLALQLLLARCGRSASVRIGVRKDHAGGFQAHAWVECDGRTLADSAAVVECYTPLVSVGPK